MRSLRSGGFDAMAAFADTHILIHGLFRKNTVYNPVGIHWHWQLQAPLSPPPHHHYTTNNESA